MPSKHYTLIRIHSDVKAVIDAAQKARGFKSANETLRDLLHLGPPSTKKAKPTT